MSYASLSRYTRNVVKDDKALGMLGTFLSLDDGTPRQDRYGDGGDRQGVFQLRQLDARPLKQVRADEDAMWAARGEADRIENDIIRRAKFAANDLEFVVAARELHVFAAKDDNWEYKRWVDDQTIKSLPKASEEDAPKPGRTTLGSLLRVANQGTTPGQRYTRDRNWGGGHTYHVWSPSATTRRAWRRATNRLTSRS
jgi:hypothetical protein